MMLIPQHVGLGATETHKNPYFVEPSGTPPAVLATVNSAVNPPGVNGAQSIFSYPAGDGCFVPGRMQPELPGLNVYAPQPGSSTLASPGNYSAVPGPVATAPGLMTPHYGTTGIEHSPYYSSLGSSYDLKTGPGDMWSGGYPQPPPGYYPYESSFGPQYPYDRYCSMDMNDGVRRKNATRESTNTLKAWLQEHKKNPYPTKGEKIMLAIITKMTLTQVSTWFANARRRLKKENKMTWIPKNRSNESATGNDKKEDDDDDDDSSQQQETDVKSEADRGADSDDSVEHEKTNANEDNAFDQSERLDEERREFPGADIGKQYAGDDEKKAVPAKGSSFTSMPCDPNRPGYDTTDTPSSAIWSPASEGQGGSSFKSERLDGSRDGECDQYNSHFVADQYPLVHRHHSSAVSPPSAREATEPNMPTQYHYPHGQQWNDNAYPNSLPQSSEVHCHAGSGLEPAERQSEGAGTPPDRDYHSHPVVPGRQYQRHSHQGLEYMPHGAYPSLHRAAEPPVRSPNAPPMRPLDASPAYQMYGHAACPEYYTRGPPHFSGNYSAPFYDQRSADHLVSTAENIHSYPRSEVVSLGANTSPPTTALTPTTSRYQQQPQRNSQVGSAPYFAQTPPAIAAPSISPSDYSAHYFPQDAPTADHRPRHLSINGRAAFNDVKQSLPGTSLSPSIHKTRFVCSPESAGTNVDVGMSPGSHVSNSERRDAASS